MAEQKGCLERYCDCHPKHQRIFEEHDKALETLHSSIGDTQNALREKVSMKLFSLLVLLIIGSLGFQLMIYDKIAKV